jgi:predicted nucleic acid-binding protein
MQPALFDTSIYISVLRRGNDAVFAMRRLAPDTPLWLSAVVLEELYAGAYGRERRAVEQLERDFDRIKRILVPNLSDWTRTGKVLAQLVVRHDYDPIGQARVTNDALIAMSAGRQGIRVLTANERDFRRLGEYSPFQWQLTTI